MVQFAIVTFVKKQRGRRNQINVTSQVESFNSVYFIQPNITNEKFSSEGFTVCTHMTSLTFDLTSDQEQLPRNPKNPFRGKK